MHLYVYLLSSERDEIKSDRYTVYIWLFFMWNWPFASAIRNVFEIGCDTEFFFFGYLV